MTTNQLTQGTRLYLTDDRTATLQDNKNGIIRLVEVEANHELGIFNDIGSVYTDEIVQYYDTELEEWQDITPIKDHKKQLEKLRLGGW